MQERAPYDRIANKWSEERTRGRFRERPYVDRLIQLTMRGAHILDLGCGCGRPIMRYLLDHGYRVTGIDASAEMLKLARINCPEAEMLFGDFATINLPHRYDGIVAWDSIFHLPKVQHEQVFRDMYEWLNPTAPLLLSVGGSENEFTAPMFGMNFFYSGHAPDHSLSLLKKAGFEILLAEIDDPSSRGHLAVLCRK